MKPERARRRTFLERHLTGVLERSILEIGAADNPTFWPEEGPVRYLDMYSTEELRRQYGANPRRNPAHLVPVTYVAGTSPPDEVVDQTFSLVIANHVVEHIPDLLDWLARVRRIAGDEGHLFLSVPDRRYTFDYLRRTTDAVDLLEHHVQGVVQPSVFTQLRGAYYHRPVRAEAAWSGRAEETAATAGPTLREAAERVAAQVDRPSDTHSHVFTHDSFVATWSELERAELVPWRLAAIEDVAPGANEFHVLLAAGPEVAELPDCFRAEPALP